MGTYNHFLSRYTFVYLYGSGFHCCIFLYFLINALINVANFETVYDDFIIRDTFIYLSRSGFHYCVRLHKVVISVIFNTHNIQ